MYWLLLSIILIPFSFITKKIERKYIYILFSMVVATFLILRFGLGVDYFSYYEIYTVYKKSFSFYTEPIFGLLNFIFNKLDLPFSVFMGFVSFLMILLTLKTISVYSENKLFSLLAKDISSFIDYGGYDVNSIYEYPYVSIFNKDKIFELRKTGINVQGIQ